jgi:ferredoxin--NADP+ reductase
VASNKQVFVIDKVLNQWRQRETGQASRRLHLHFFAKPVEIVEALADDGTGTGRVGAIRYERTAPDGEGGVVGTGEIREIPIQAVYRAVGYFGSPLPGVPFDKKRGVIPNREGQVLWKNPESGSGAATQQLYGVYATGWIKRGPVGLIGHTKSDAMETVRHLINDQGNWWRPESPSEESMTELLESRGVKYTNLDGWHNLDQHELALGEAAGRVRVKVVPREEMVAISRKEN